MVYQAIALHGIIPTYQDITLTGVTKPLLLRFEGTVNLVKGPWLERS